jgi:hypothetical protein
MSTAVAGTTPFRPTGSYTKPRDVTKALGGVARTSDFRQRGLAPREAVLDQTGAPQLRRPR